ncbi:hypothetical protein EC973_009333 [Apophysomyces ossiformis]|uniref:Lung seven transmembrane receptor-domain-containing protein n=1 Tax=Apophysomyces ossiformis TaxID=679940 RepID=A0A8H7C0G0_9FUNG|nr:hypothetical protein EC973_009333 [Apophysomyces ossiformis]
MKTSDNYYSTTCSGVWSKNDFPGWRQPFIKVTLGPSSHGKAALLIYEWADFDNIGIYNNVTHQTQYLCDQKAVAQKLCTNATLDQFITHGDPKTTSIMTSTFDMHNKSQVALYKVEKTGYYCVAVIPATNNTAFEAWVEWKFPYGELPAVDYPKLVFYGVFSLIYLAVGLFWGIQSFRYWHDILPVQHFLSGAIFFLTVEMAFNFGFWEAYNQTGKPSWGLLALVALLNAGRNSVVKPHLGSAMKKCALLAVTHFVFGVIYSLGTMLLSPESAGFIVLLCVFPLAITMTAFYIWTLSAITMTLATLEMRKQHVKALMYKRLYRLLVFSVLMVLLIFIVNMFMFADRTSIGWAARNWKRRWFMLDGWLNILYFVVFFTIIVLWRPTSNNARYGLEQISQDEEEALDLENRLRRAEGGHNARRDDEDAIFDLGDDFSDDEGHQRVKLVSVGNGNGNHSTPAQQEASSIPQLSNQRQPKGDERDALLHGHEEDEDEDIRDDERARLTDNARKLS